VPQRACGTALAAGRQPGHRAHYGAEVAGACPAHHDRNLRERSGRGGAEHRCADVVSGPGPGQKGTLLSCVITDIV
jgi:hypothetical protein